MARALLWLGEDLRMEDSLAIATARASGGLSLAAAFRIDPEARGRPARTAGRKACEDAALRRMRAALAAWGAPLEEAHVGDDCSVAAACRRNRCQVAVRNASTGTPEEAAWLDEQAGGLEAEGIGLVTVDGESVARAAGGGRKAELPHLDADREMAAAAADVGHPFARLRRFLAELPSRRYRELMWVPGPDRSATSMLSADIACGALSADRALREARRAEARWLAAHPAEGGSAALGAFKSYQARLGWRRGFLSAYASATDAPPVASDTQARARLDSWRSGATGVPMVDAAMRELGATGWVNFRMRQMTASFATQALGLPMADAGLALAEMLDDYEPGIHWCQMGLHAGALARERGPRIVNPVKQGRDLDPTEAYVRHWLPELAGLPHGFGHEPWRHPGSRVVPRIVDHEAAARDARASYPGKAARRSVGRQASLL